MKSKHVLPLSLLALACGAGAQTLKPGLWEITNQTRMSGDTKGQDPMAQMNQQMASMTPEQRKKVEEMMAKNGVKMGSGGPGAGEGGDDCSSDLRDGAGIERRLAGGAVRKGHDDIGQCAAGCAGVPFQRRGRRAHAPAAGDQDARCGDIA